MSPADLCAVNGWKVGDRLVGDEGYGPTVIEITAIGWFEILAMQISHTDTSGETLHLEYREGSWCLEDREWELVAA